MAEAAEEGFTVWQTLEPCPAGFALLSKLHTCAVKVHHDTPTFRLCM